MKVKITKPTHVYVLPCEVEVNEAEAHRLLMVGVAEPCETREAPEEKVQRTTRKGKK